MDLREETISILNKYGLRANKKLGQNFLISEDVVNEIVEKSDITSDDVIIEIGPGLGTLTKELVKRAKKMFAIELDENMIEILNTRFQVFQNLEIINDDVLKVDLKELTKDFSNIKVVANLPYYITTPIIMKLLEDRINIKSITVMVQKEVGERLCATHLDKEYGAISVSVRYYTNPQIIIDVPKENFLPSPEVDSCVIKLDLLENPRVELKNEKLFFRLIKGAFTQRRKTINNSLTCTGKSKEEINEILQKLNIEPKLRAENLSLEDYARISDLMSEQ